MSAAAASDLAPATLSPPHVTLIVALAENGVIGCDNRLPWHLPDDLRRFKALTTGHPIIMGRKTYESIGKPLPKRLNVVLSQAPGFAPPGVTVVASPAAALAACAGQAGPLFVIGGAQIYALFLPLATHLELTRVHITEPGDVVFPPLDLRAWRLLHAEPHPRDERHAHAFTWQTYTRV